MTTYSYNPNGEMIIRTTGTTTTDYLFDGMEVVQEKIGTNAATLLRPGPRGPTHLSQGRRLPLKITTTTP